MRRMIRDVYQQVFRVDNIQVEMLGTQNDDCMAPTADPLPRLDLSPSIGWSYHAFPPSSLYSCKEEFFNGVLIPKKTATLIR